MPPLSGIGGPCRRRRRAQEAAAEQRGARLARAPARRASNAPTSRPVDRAAKDSLESAQKSLGKLGTGHGRSEDSRVTMVAFERATDSPAETVAIQYDRRENLVAMGVLPQPYYARRQQPDPFPAALRFAPDPR